MFKSCILFRMDSLVISVVFGLSLDFKKLYPQMRLFGNFFCRNVVLSKHKVVCLDILVRNLCILLHVFLVHEFQTWQAWAFSGSQLAFGSVVSSIYFRMLTV